MTASLCGIPDYPVHFDLRKLCLVVYSTRAPSRSKGNLALCKLLSSILPILLNAKFKIGNGAFAASVPKQTNAAKQGLNEYLI
jgi:hypothetical protein